MIWGLRLATCSATWYLFMPGSISAPTHTRPGFQARKGRQLMFELLGPCSHAGRHAGRPSASAYSLQRHSLSTRQHTLQTGHMSQHSFGPSQHQVTFRSTLPGS